MLIADLIFPAFFYPYGVKFLYPVAAVLGLAVEVAVFRLFYRQVSLPRLIALVVACNVVSSLLGVALARILPSGVPSHAEPFSSPEHLAYKRLFWASWPLAFGLREILGSGLEYAIRSHGSPASP